MLSAGTLVCGLAKEIIQYEIGRVTIGLEIMTSNLAFKLQNCFKFKIIFIVGIEIKIHLIVRLLDNPPSAISSSVYEDLSMRQSPMSNFIGQLESYHYKDIIIVSIRI